MYMYISIQTKSERLKQKSDLMHTSVHYIQNLVRVSKVPFPNVLTVTLCEKHVYHLCMYSVYSLCVIYSMSGGSN